MNHAIDVRRPVRTRSRWNPGHLGWVLALLATFAALAGGWTPAAAPAEPDCEEWIVPERRARAANPIAAAEADLASGRANFLRECASCHGETGRNDGPEAADVDMSCARLLTDPELLKLTDGALFWKIREGRGSMPNTLDVLRDRDRWELVHYIRTLVEGGP